MTTGRVTSTPSSGGWTTDDLDAQPDDGVRRELLDGVMLVAPARSALHQFLAAALTMSLHASGPRSAAVTQSVEVRMSDRLSFIPDVVVLSADAAKRKPRPFAPHEVLLVVEIVSPASQAMDRITKPVLYAKAGIPYFWRIETSDGIAVDTYKINPESEAYLPVGTYSDIIKIDEPWPIEISVNHLIPSFLVDRG